MNPLDPSPVVLPLFEFGTVLQHALLHDVLYLVLTPFNTPSGATQDYKALRLTPGESYSYAQGQVVIIGHSSVGDWNVLEVIRVDG